MRVALAQFQIIHHAPEENLIKAERFIQKAARQDADVIVFPEIFLTGPIDGQDNLIDAGGSHRNKLQQMAGDYRIDIVSGSIIEKEDSTIHNNSYYIDSSGRISGKYSKINLWQPERKKWSAGTDVCVFTTRFGRAGIIVCWDMVYPELFRRMVLQGVEIVFCPSYWCCQLYGNEVKHDPDAEIKHVDALCVTRAFENNIALVYTNAAGMNESSDSKPYPKKLIGHSQICLPFKGELAKQSDNNESLLIQEIPLDILKDAEELYRLRTDIQTRDKNQPVLTD